MDVELEVDFTHPSLPEVGEEPEVPDLTPEEVKEGPADEEVVSNENVTTESAYKSERKIWVNELNAPVNRPNIFRKDKEESKGRSPRGRAEEPIDGEFNIETDRVEADDEDHHEKPKNSLPSSTSTRFKQSIDQEFDQREEQHKVSASGKDGAENLSPSVPPPTKSIQVPNSGDRFKKMVEHIPCLYLPYEEGADKLTLYFHGNAEDIGLAFDLVYLIGQKM